MPDSSNHEIPNWSKLSDEEFENEILKPISLKLGEAEIIFDEKKSWHLIRPKNEVIVVNNVVSHQESIRDDSSTQSFIKERLCYEEEIKLLTDQVNSLSSKLSEYTLQKTSSDHEKDAVVNMVRIFFIRKDLLLSIN